MKHDIFLSYRRTDREFAAQLVQSLEKRGLDVWYDAEIEGGQDWREEIVGALESSAMLVILFSESCNESRQLKKELAVADSLEKPVVPILIEECRPKGAYLYELADRNWIQAFPEPHTRIGELVEHLQALVGKTPGPPPAAAAPGAGAPEAAAIQDAVSREEVVSKKADLAAAYVGKKDVAPSVARRSDILPFLWVDAAILAPILAAYALWSWFASDLFTEAEKSSATGLAALGVMLVALVGFYGAVIFPIRYFMRGRAVLPALISYAISSLILFAVAYGAFYSGHAAGLFPGDDPIDVAALFATLWGGYTLVGFILYAALAGQRALKAFRSNIRKI